MVYITGDTHGDWSRIEKLKYLTDEDTVIVCGDFGLWHETPQETAGLDRLNHMPFSTVWVDGNHENFDRLNSDEFETVNFHGALSHKIRDKVFHIKRGEIMTLEGKTFWCFGGASSHDIRDGIIDPAKYRTEADFNEAVWLARYEGKQFRIKGVSWWPEEMPSNEELGHGTATLIDRGWKVDYVVTHCAPMRVQAALGFHTQDRLTLYFDAMLSDGLDFKRWFFGHYHMSRTHMLDDRFMCLWGDIVPAWPVWAETEEKG